MQFRPRMRGFLLLTALVVMSLSTRAIEGANFRYPEGHPMVGGNCGIMKVSRF